MKQTFFARRYILLTLLSGFLSAHLWAAITPPFTLTGVSDSSISENTIYISDMPSVDGDISGAITYSLLSSADIRFPNDLPIFSGMDIFQIFFFIMAQDNDLFTINPDGIVSLPAQDFENPRHANNIYQVTIVATDEAGNRNTLSWGVTILDQPAQSFTLSGINNASVYENSRYSSNTPSMTGGSVGTIIYSLSGDDALAFTVNPSTGVVDLLPRDFENPTDANADNIYEVTLVATDGDQNTASLRWSVTILDQPPLHFTLASLNKSVNEGVDYTSPAPSISGSYRPPLSYALSGDDAALFSLSGGKVVLAAKDYSSPLDANLDNVYEAILTATDNDGNTSSASISVTIIDIPFVAGNDDDGDGVINAVEIAEGTDPFDSSSFKDTDNDGIPDALETDADNDGISNIDESQGIDPYGDNDNDAVPNYLDADDRGDGMAAQCRDDDHNLICDNYQPLDPLFDADQDTNANHADIDSDNDLIPDIIEGTVDTDGDGKGNWIDIDSDGDGIPDIVESGTDGKDSDLDGIADYYSFAIHGGADANGDGIDDTRLPPDHDGDGTPDYLDTDSDNDGIPDALEGSYSNDSDGDGIDDRYDINNVPGNDYNNDGINDALSAPDTDGDSFPDYLDIDSDGDGISDTIESGASLQDINNNGIDDRFDAAINAGIDNNGDGILEDQFINSDNDALPDFRDLDSDNDTIMDVEEAGGVDANQDALSDHAALISTPLPDDDNDGIPNYREVDSNNDGIFDIANGTLANLDTDGDGMVDITTDEDNDGIDTLADSAPTIYGLLALDIIDTDGDGVADYFDLDSDGDGISNIEEGTGDTDGDGIPNYLDLDSDGDGISDYVEAGLPPKIGVSNTDGIDDSIAVLIVGGDDLNHDGVADRFAPIDSDNDGIPDYKDTDSDNDGILDNTETSNLARLNIDSDHDGIDDAYDIDITQGIDANFDGIDDDLVPIIDTDGDGIANFRDADSDNDLISDSEEGTIDTDGDGIPNYLDLDSDGDGISDYVESRAPEKLGDSNNNGIDDAIDHLIQHGIDANHDNIDDKFKADDNDKDGTPNYLDLDSDNDTLSDNYETSNLAPVGILPLGVDSNQNGINDAYDVTITLGTDANNDGVDDDLVPILDTDNDGLPNYLDKDSDNDGFLDGLEDSDANHDGIPDRLQADGKIKTSSGSGSTSLLSLLLLSAMLLLRPLSRRRGLLALAIFALLSANTFAEDIDICRDYHLLPSTTKAFAPCFYVGFGIGQMQADADTTDSSWKVNKDQDTSYALYAGWHFSHSFFTELMISELGKITLNNAHPLITQEESISYSAYSAFLGYYLPMDLLWGENVPIKFFIKGGISQLVNSTSSSLVRLDTKQQVIAATGLGIEWNINQDWMMRGEVNTFTSEVQYIGISAGYWFGGGRYHYSLTPEPSAQEQAQATEATATTETTLTEEVVAEAVPVIPPINNDADEDGVDDSIDKCLNTRKKARVDATGCATYPGYIQSLYGAFNSTDLVYTSFGHLDTVIVLMRTYPDTRIEIQAHTDNTGDDDVNLKLSNARAQTVKDYIVSRGIDASRIQTKGFGESKPLGDNNTLEGRSKNRRIDFVILKP